MVVKSNDQRYTVNKTNCSVSMWLKLLSAVITTFYFSDADADALVKKITFSIVNTNRRS